MLRCKLGHLKSVMFLLSAIFCGCSTLTQPGIEIISRELMYFKKSETYAVWPNEEINDHDMQQIKKVLDNIHVEMDKRGLEESEIPEEAAIGIIVTFNSFRAEMSPADNELVAPGFTRGLDPAEWPGVGPNFLDDRSRETYIHVLSIEAIDQQTYFATEEIVTYAYTTAMTTSRSQSLGRVLPAMVSAIEPFVLVNSEELIYVDAAKLSLVEE